MQQFLWHNKPELTDDLHTDYFQQDLQYSRNSDHRWKVADMITDITSMYFMYELSVEKFTSIENY
jgi:hypothetical protein